MPKKYHGFDDHQPRFGTQKLLIKFSVNSLLADKYEFNYPRNIHECELSLPISFARGQEEIKSVLDLQNCQEGG